MVKRKERDQALRGLGTTEVGVQKKVLEWMLRRWQQLPQREERVAEVGE